jgi:hypothetical protein
MIPRTILKNISTFKLIWNWLALLACGGLLGCATTPTTHSRPDATEWFPTLDATFAVDDLSRQEILQKCGVKEAATFWTRALDLDQDGKEDCIVTIALPEVKGPYWTGFRSVTYVFRGGNEGAFNSGWNAATLWFSLVTYQGLMHARYGDSQTIRQFSLLRRDGQWLVKGEEHEYGNEGGDALTRLMKRKKSVAWILPPAEIPPANPY